ncbi:hypothetical protein BpHYR1_035440 [Brachionus plicatilis]|uniref:Uncharacterized protein n=1 Tax=Brachionus plicatilis TaxID=10195 RepID=A0A3M7P903_BRAPC|nr:hypothetical protein BpHYR1_035440 [Brachionus plicatilis]
MNVLQRDFVCLTVNQQASAHTKSEKIRFMLLKIECLNVVNFNIDLLITKQFISREKKNPKISKVLGYFDYLFTTVMNFLRDLRENGVKKKHINKHISSKISLLKKNTNYQ